MNIIRRIVLLLVPITIFNVVLAIPYKVIIHNPNSYDLINYQVRINLSSVFSTPQPIQVCTDLSCTQRLNFCYEQSDRSCNTNPTTTIWVRIPRIPASGSTTIYIVPGTNGATKGENVFVVYEDFEDGVLDGWSFRGNRGWQICTDTPYGIVQGKRVGCNQDIWDSQVACMYKTITSNHRVLLTFWWSVHSEYGFDFLRFYVDGYYIWGISGYVSWQQKSYTIPAGTHTIEFCYTKDGSVSWGRDTGYVDLIIGRTVADKEPTYTITPAYIVRSNVDISPTDIIINLDIQPVVHIQVNSVPDSIPITVSVYLDNVLQYQNTHNTNFTLQVPLTIDTSQVGVHPVRIVLKGEGYEKEYYFTIRVTSPWLYDEATKRTIYVVNTDRDYNNAWVVLRGTFTKNPAVGVYVPSVGDEVRTYSKVLEKRVVGTSKIYINITNNNDYNLVNQQVLVPLLKLGGYSLDVLNGDRVRPTHPNLKQQVSERTVCMWFYPVSLQGVQVLYEEGGWVNGLNIYLYNGILRVGVWAENSRFHLHPYITPVQPERWYHICYVFKGGSYVKVYINGKLVYSTPISLPYVPVHTDNPAIGGSSQYTEINGQDVSGTYKFLGYIDEVVIYNRALSEKEVRQVYAGEIPPSPIQYFKFEQNLKDSATGYDAIPYGTVRYTSGVQGAYLPIDEKYLILEDKDGNRYPYCFENIVGQCVPKWSYGSHYLWTKVNVPAHSTLQLVLHGESTIRVRIKITNKGSTDYQDISIRIPIHEFPQSIIGKMRIVDEEGDYVPFCYEYDNGECGKYDPSKSIVAIWVKVSVPAGKTITLYAEESETDGSTTGSHVFLVYDDFTSLSGWRVYRVRNDPNTECKLYNGVLFLTEDVTDRGCAIYKDNIQPPFVLELKFKICEPSDGRHADGMAFCWMKSREGVGGGGSLGIYSDSTQYCIEVDTWDNGLTDPSVPYIAVIDPARGWSGGWYRISGWYRDSSIWDCNWHVLRAEVLTNSVNVYYDGRLVLSNVRYTPRSGTKISLSAATGGEDEEHIVDWIKIYKYYNPNDIEVVVDNPLKNNPSQVFIFYDDFKNLEKWNVLKESNDEVYITTEYGYSVLHISETSSDNDWVTISSKVQVPTKNIVIESLFRVYKRIDDRDSRWDGDLEIGLTRVNNVRDPSNYRIYRLYTGDAPGDSYQVAQISGTSCVNIDNLGVLGQNWVSFIRITSTTSTVTGFITSPKGRASASTTFDPSYNTGYLTLGTNGGYGNYDLPAYRIYYVKVYHRYSNVQVNVEAEELYSGKLAVYLGNVRGDTNYIISIYDTSDNLSVRDIEGTLLEPVYLPPYIPQNAIVKEVVVHNNEGTKRENAVIEIDLTQVVENPYNYIFYVLDKDGYPVPSCLLTPEGECVFEEFGEEYSPKGIELGYIIPYPNVPPLRMTFIVGPKRGTEGKILLVRYAGYGGHPSNHQGLVSNYNYNTIYDVRLVDVIDSYAIYHSTNIGDYYNFLFVTWMYVEKPGTWCFGMSSDDSGEIEIDGRVIVSFYGQRGANLNYPQNSGCTYLSQGWHLLIVRHEEDWGGDAIKVWYKAPGDTNWQVFSVQNLKGKARLYAYRPDMWVLKSYYFIVKGLKYTPGILFSQLSNQPIDGAHGWVPAVYIGYDGRVRVSIFWSGSSNNQIVGWDITDGRVHNITITYSGGTTGTFCLYIDGVRVGCRTVTQREYYPYRYTYYLGFGKWTSWPGSFGRSYVRFTGVLKYVKIERLDTHQVLVLYPKKLAFRVGTIGPHENKTFYIVAVPRSTTEEVPRPVVYKVYANSNYQDVLVTLSLPKYLEGKPIKVLYSKDGEKWVEVPYKYLNGYKSYIIVQVPEVVRGYIYLSVVPENGAPSSVQGSTVNVEVRPADPYIIYDSFEYGLSSILWTTSCYNGCPYVEDGKLVLVPISINRGGLVRYNLYGITPRTPSIIEFGFIIDWVCATSNDGDGLAVTIGGAITNAYSACSKGFSNSDEQGLVIEVWDDWDVFTSQNNGIGIDTDTGSCGPDSNYVYRTPSVKSKNLRRAKVVLDGNYAHLYYEGRLVLQNVPLPTSWYSGALQIGAGTGCSNCNSYYCNKPDSGHYLDYIKVSGYASLSYSIEEIHGVVITSTYEEYKPSLPRWELKVPSDLGNYTIPEYNEATKYWYHTLEIPALRVQITGTSKDYIHISVPVQYDYPYIRVYAPSSTNVGDYLSGVHGIPFRKDPYGYIHIYVPRDIANTVDYVYIVYGYPVGEQPEYRILIDEVGRYDNGGVSIPNEDSIKALFNYVGVLEVDKSTYGRQVLVLRIPKEDVYSKLLHDFLNYTYVTLILPDQKKVLLPLKSIEETDTHFIIKVDSVIPSTGVLKIEILTKPIDEVPPNNVVKYTSLYDEVQYPYNWITAPPSNVLRTGQVPVLYRGDTFSITFELAPIKYVYVIDEYALQGSQFRLYGGDVIIPLDVIFNPNTMSGTLHGKVGEGDEFLQAQLYMGVCNIRGCTNTLVETTIENKPIVPVNCTFYLWEDDPYGFSVNVYDLFDDYESEPFGVFKGIVSDGSTLLIDRYRIQLDDIKLVEFDENGELVRERTFNNYYDLENAIKSSTSKYKLIYIPDVRYIPASLAGTLSSLGCYLYRAYSDRSVVSYLAISNGTTCYEYLGLGGIREDNRIMLQSASTDSNKITCTPSSDTVSCGKPEKDWYGTVHLTVQARDGDGSSVTKTYDIKVLEVNDEPSVQVLDIPQYSLISGFEFKLKCTDKEEDCKPLVVITVNDTVKVQPSSIKSMGIIYTYHEPFGTIRYRDMLTVDSDKVSVGLSTTADIFNRTSTLLSPRSFLGVLTYTSPVGDIIKYEGLAPMQYYSKYEEAQKAPWYSHVLWGIDYGASEGGHILFTLYSEQHVPIYKFVVLKKNTNFGVIVYRIVGKGTIDIGKYVVRVTEGTSVQIEGKYVKLCKGSMCVFMYSDKVWKYDRDNNIVYFDVGKVTVNGVYDLIIPIGIGVSSLQYEFRKFVRDESTGLARGTDVIVLDEGSCTRNGEVWTCKVNGPLVPGWYRLDIFAIDSRGQLSRPESKYVLVLPPDALVIRLYFHEENTHFNKTEEKFQYREAWLVVPPAQPHHLIFEIKSSVFTKVAYEITPCDYLMYNDKCSGTIPVSNTPQNYTFIFQSPVRGIYEYNITFYIPELPDLKIMYTLHIMNNYECEIQYIYVEPSRTFANKPIKVVWAWIGRNSWFVQMPVNFTYTIDLMTHDRTRVLDNIDNGTSQFTTTLQRKEKIYLLRTTYAAYSTPGRTVYIHYKFEPSVFCVHNQLEGYIPLQVLTSDIVLLYLKYYILYSPHTFPEYLSYISREIGVTFDPEKFNAYLRLIKEPIKERYYRASEEVQRFFKG